MARPSGTSATPSPATRWVAMPTTSRSKTLMLPDAAFTSWTMDFSVLVLPAPLAPIDVTISPRRTSSSTPFTAAMPPYDTCRPLMARSTGASLTGALHPLGRDTRPRPSGSRLIVLGRSLRDGLAVVDHVDGVAHAEHHAHVVLDQDDREPHLVAQEADLLLQVARFLAVHARRRLVEQDHLRREHQGARDLEPALRAVRASCPRDRCAPPSSRTPRAAPALAR